MGLFDFVKEAGEKLFHHDQEQDPEVINQGLADAIVERINELGLDIYDLAVSVEEGTVTLSGEAADNETREKAVLAAGNVDGIGAVDDQMSVAAVEYEDEDGEGNYDEEAETDETASDSEFYTVKRGDTLSKIAREFYGDASEYMTIFEANQPMLDDPDEIYPGQVLRIPVVE